jgi:5-methylcytosine-specific restriction protein B
MAVIVGKEAIYEAADLFRRRCLTEGSSLLWPESRAWTLENIGQLWEAFIGNPDIGERSFLAKWRDQLSQSSPDVHRVACDVVAFYYLFPSNSQISKETKLSRLREVVSWKLGDEAPELALITKAYAAGGVGSTGPLYQMSVPWQVGYFLKFAQHALEEHVDLSNAAACKVLADRTKDEVQSSAGARNVLLYLLFPMVFQRIASDDHKERIVETFGPSVPGIPHDTDEALEAIRQSLATAANRPDLDFYESDIERKWSKPKRAKTPLTKKGGRVSEPVVPPGIGTVFTEQTFNLLKGLAAQPTQDFYSAHKQDFKQHVEEPFHRLFERVVEHLRPEVKAPLETENRVFSRIAKNDYGRGGAWPFYWGALYPKGGKRTEDTQLYIWMNGDLLRFGFTFGTYSSDQERRFIRNCREYHSVIAPLLKDSLDGRGFVFGAPEDFDEAWGSSPEGNGRSLQEWLKDPEAPGIRAAIILPRADVLARSLEALSGQIAEAFERCFPLVLLATQETPLPAIRRYLEIEEEPVDPHLEYSLDQLATETLLDSSLLTRWVDAIERKGQAIIYGPPGTGKTFLAERLAKHLVGGGDGVLSIVQFHPAYTYEDFIQGIRPQPRPEGGLSYPILPGRFLEFCDEARARKGKSVLIVDEINRANLARVFGELMYLLEYRDRQIPLAGGGVLQIPNTVRVIGTMNTADRSIALVDHALRRRFAFLPLQPNYDVLRRFHERTGFSVEPLIQVLLQVNNQIGDPHYHIGTSFFLRRDLGRHLEDIWRLEIEPYLEEFFFDRPEKIAPFRWESIKPKVKG